MIWPLIVGVVMDYVGIGVGLVGTTAFCLVGQIVYTLGAKNPEKSFGYLVGGRVLFGLGGEALVAGQSAIIATWFAGKELNMALGASLSMGRLGGALVTRPLTGGYEVPEGSEMNAVQYASMIAVIILVVAFVGAVLMMILDMWATKKDKIHATAEDDKVNLQDFKEFGLPFWLLVGSCVTCYGAILTWMSNVNILHHFFGFYEDTSGSFSGVNRSTWDNWSQPGFVCFCIPFVLSPVLGYMVDKLGRRTYFNLAANSAVMLAIVWYWCMPYSYKWDNNSGLPGNMVVPTSTGPRHAAYGAAILFGVGYTLYAAVLWGCVPYTCSPRTLGSAYGLITAIQNIGLSTIPYLWSVFANIGFDREDAKYTSFDCTTEQEYCYEDPNCGFWYNICDTNQMRYVGYGKQSLIFLFCLSAVGQCFNVWLLIDDKRNRGGVLSAAGSASYTQVEEIKKPGLEESTGRVDTSPSASSSSNSSQEEEEMKSFIDGELATTQDQSKDSGGRLAEAEKGDQESSDH